MARKKKSAAAREPKHDNSLNVAELMKLETETAEQTIPPTDAKVEEELEKEVLDLKEGKGMEAFDERTRKLVAHYLHEAFPKWKLDFFDNTRVRTGLGFRVSMFESTKAILAFPWSEEMMTPPRMMGGRLFHDRRTMPKYIPGVMVAQVMHATTGVLQDIYGQYVNAIMQKKLEDDQMQIPPKKGDKTSKFRRFKPEKREWLFEKLKEIALEQGKLLAKFQKKRAAAEAELFKEYAAVMEKGAAAMMDDTTKELIEKFEAPEDTEKRLDVWDTLFATVKTQYCFRFIRIQEIYFRTLLQAHGRVQNFAFTHQDPYAKSNKIETVSSPVRQNYLSMFDAELGLYNDALLTFRTTNVDYFTNDFEIPPYNKLTDEEKRLFKLNKEEFKRERTEYEKIRAGMVTRKFDASVAKPKQDDGDEEKDVVSLEEKEEVQETAQQDLQS